MKTLICLLLLTGLTLSAGEPSKVDGTKVTGTVGPNLDHQFAIRNGKLDAGKLTFEVLMEDPVAFDLVFDGNTIRGSATGTGEGGEKMSAKVDLKRVT
jgi:hypothetical protein